MACNWIKVVFGAIIVLVVFLGTLVNKFSDSIPAIIKEIYLYGKFAYKGKDTKVHSVQVPKRWFKHFYVFASISSLVGFLLMGAVYLVLGEAPRNVNNILTSVAGDSRTATVSATCSMLAITLLMLQSCKRMYETFYVSVFSDTKIDIGHYFLGFLHYIGAVAAILAEAPGFTNTTSDFTAKLQFKEITPTVILASAVFLWASRKQLDTATILGNMRKDKKGVVVTLKHDIPKGGLFEYVSSPHLMCEILMYNCLTYILWGNSTWIYIYLWVLSNQVETSFLTHWWYQKEFKNYPKNRKALIPFII